MRDAGEIVIKNRLKDKSKRSSGASTTFRKATSQAHCAWEVNLSGDWDHQ